MLSRSLPLLLNWNATFVSSPSLSVRVLVSPMSKSTIPKAAMFKSPLTEALEANCSGQVSMPTLVTVAVSVKPHDSVAERRFTPLKLTVKSSSSPAASVNESSESSMSTCVPSHSFSTVMVSSSDEGFVTVQVISTVGVFNGCTSISGCFSSQSISTPGKDCAWAAMGSVAKVRSITNPNALRIMRLRPDVW